MPTKQKVALEIQILRSSDTRRTVEEIAALELRLSELNAQIRQAKKEGKSNVYTRLRVEADGVKTEVQGLNKALRQQKKDFEAISFAPGSYQALSAELSKAKREFKELSREARDGIGGRDLRARIQRLDRELKQIDSSVGVFSRNVGNYASAFRALGPALAAVGIGVGVSELVQAGRQAIETFKGFQQEIATLQAISGATGDELQQLEQNARRLGETTQFTARQVAELQTNFARTGFNTQQILSATEATVNLAIATGEGVVQASDVVGSAVKGFGLAAGEAERITDVMTAAFNTSRLNLERWAEAQKFLAPVASSIGVDIEAAAAAMAALGDAGLEGSMIGTGLRRILVDLGNENSKLSKFIGFSVKSTEDFTRAMEVLSDANLDSTKSFELVGRIGQTALLNLANRGRDVFRDGELVKGISTLTEEFQNAAGAAERTAAIVGDTLSQDLLKAKSAIEGLQINVVSLANTGLRNMVQGFTSLVDTLNRFVAVPVSEQLEEERRGLNALVTQLTDVNVGESRRADIIAELQAKFPRFLESIDIETASNNELRQALSRVNEEYTQRILLQKLAEDVEKRQLALEKARGREVDRQISFADALAQARKFLGNETLSYEEVLKTLEAQERRNLNVFTTAQVQTTEAQRLRSQLVVAFGAEAKARERTAKAQDNLNEAEKVRVERLELLKEQFPELAAAVDAIEQATTRYTKEVEVSGKSADELRAILADLKAQLEDTPEGSPLFEELTDEIEQVEAAILKLTKDGGGNITKFVKGSLAALNTELSDLKKRLDEIPASAAGYADVLGRIQVVQREIDEQLKLRGLLTFNADDFAGTAREVESAIAQLEIALQTISRDPIEISALRGGETFVDVDGNVNAIKKVEAERIISLQRQLQAGLISEQEFQRAREEISQQTELAVIDARLAAYEVGSVEYLQLVQQRADKELEIENANAERIAQNQKSLRERIKDAAIQAAGDVGSAIVTIERNNVEAELDARLSAIDKQYEARFEAAQGNEELIAKLEEERDRKVAEAEKAAARRRKEIAQKEAVIQSALAAVRLIANVSFPAVIPLLAAQAIALAAQLATINSQQFALGGVVRGKAHSQGGEHFIVRSTGQHVELEGGEAVINRRSMASRDIISATGTPAQIASVINAHKGYGRPFQPSWAKPMTLPKFEGGGIVPKSPQFVNPNSQQVTAIVEIPRDQMMEMAVLIARETSKATAAQTGQSVELALTNANRATERKKFVSNKTGVR